MNAERESRFAHLRHKPPAKLERSRGLIVACAPMRSQVNLSRIVRTAGCMGVKRIIATGPNKIDKKIARDAADGIEISTHRSLPPILIKLKQQGFEIVGLEQTTNSTCLYDFEFAYQTVLVVGNERQGLSSEALDAVQHVVEIPVHGMPFSLNAATATCMAMYEYCRQFPNG